MISLRRLPAVLLILTAVLSFVPTQARPAPERYFIYPTRTEVAIRVTVFLIFELEGRFSRFEGKFTLDPEDVTSGEFELFIEAASISTGDKFFDRRFRSPDYLDVEAHPTLTFIGTRIEKTGEDTGRIIGNLTMAGVTKEISLDIDYLGSTQGPGDDEPAMVTFRAAGSFNRSDFGMVNDMPLTSDKVEMELMIVAGNRFGFIPPPLVQSVEDPHAAEPTSSKRPDFSRQ